MLSPEIQEAAAEFGRVLRQAPVLVSYRASAEDLDADPAAQRVIAALQEQNTVMARLHQAGLTPGEAAIEKLRTCQAAVRANATVMAYLRAANEAKAYLPTVGREVSAALGADYGALVAPSC